MKEPGLLLLSGNTFPWGSRSALERTQGDTGNVLLPEPSPPGPGESQGDLEEEYQLNREKMMGNYARLERIPYPPLRDLSAVGYSQGTT